MVEVYDFPKLESPFIRKDIDEKYVCIPEIDNNYRWIFKPGSVCAVEKLDGTNVSIIVKNKEIITIYNRLNKIPFFKKGYKRFYEGIQNAIDREYISLEHLKDGQYFGELCGPVVNGNPLHLDEHLWFPFDLLVIRDKFKFWDNFIKELEGKNDKDIFNSVSKVFEGLWSLEHRRKGKKEFAEGIVFYDNKGSMCKLRRDMFDWFKGKNHKKES